MTQGSERRKQRRWVRNFKPGESVTITYAGKRRGRVIVLSPGDATLTVDKRTQNRKNS